MGAGFTRRQVLGAAVIGGFGLVTLTSCFGSAQPGPVSTPLPVRPALPTPIVAASVDGVLNVDLVAQITQVGVGAEQLITAWTYGGTLPGTTWEVRPGDRMKIRLANHLPALPGDEGDVMHHDGATSSQYAGTEMTRPHQWTTTNLHVHGMHVDPGAPGDDVFLAVAPNQYYPYEIQVPSDHPGGLFWYHPHSHGGATQQVRGGMAGAIVVRGEIDEVPEVAAAAERVMVLQAIELGEDWAVEEPIANPDKAEAFFPRYRTLWTINGAYLPRIQMYPGEVQRWRIVNAAEGKLASLKLNGHRVHQLAWDGLTMAAPVAADDTLLYPANRVEVLVKAGGAGTYDLVLSPASSQKPFAPGMPETTQPPGSDGAVSGELVPRTIATVEVVGTGPEMALPTTLPAYNPTRMPVKATRTVRYTVDRFPDGSFIAFGIDDKPFDPDAVAYRMQVGTSEEWTVVNDSDQGFVHVMHIHVNPFLVTKINGAPVTPFWRDTFGIGPNLGDSFTAILSLTDFTGKFVQHCHVLGHEDTGMMEALEITFPDGTTNDE